MRGPLLLVPALLLEAAPALLLALAMPSLRLLAVNAARATGLEGSLGDGSTTGGILRAEGLLS